MIHKPIPKILFSIVGLLLGIFYLMKPSNQFNEDIPTAKVEIRDFIVNVKATGELEAARSMIIVSCVRGDSGKIIYLIPDGITVKPGDLLVKMDPTPFEEKLDKLRSQIKEQEAYITTLEQTLDWEINQADHENKTAAFEVETAELELEKIMRGDGPLETSRLKGVMQKAWLKYEELKGYVDDLTALEQDGFLNPGEIKQAQKKLLEEQEAYDTAKLQYESYVNHVYPMQSKKAETALKRAKIKQEEMAKTGGYKVGKAMALLDQAEQTLKDYLVQLREDERELALTEIKAPAPGMVVHREEYRSGQKRKPRIGDILVKNQPLLDLPDLNSMLVKTKVREVDLFKVAVGKKAIIRVDAYPHLTFSGLVSSIGVLALSDLARASEEKYFEVRIALNEGDHRLRPGMTTRAIIHADQVVNGLTIPLHAVFEEEKKNFCYVSKAGRYEKRLIEVGISNEQWAQIVSGLKEEEAVCLINPFLKETE